MSVTLRIDRPNASLDTAYVDATAVAGGLPLLLPALPVELAPDVVRELDGLILSGGADVDPARYGADPHPSTQPADAVRDAFEIAVVRAAIDQQVPVLAVCRGMQVLNVACGGTLIQHVPDVTRHEHTDIERWDVSANPVTVADGTLLHDVVGLSHLTVNSLHHQAVDEVADGFRVSAVDEVGIVEAIEPVDGRPVLGVQWHPELLQREPVHEALFVWLVNRARDRRAALHP
jgi:putative glutamine amidotransferase